MTRMQSIDPCHVRPDGPVYLRLLAEHGVAGADWFDWFVQLDREAADAMGGTLSMLAAASKLDEQSKSELHQATSQASAGYWRRAQVTAFRWMTDADLRVACDAYLASVEHRASVERMTARRPGAARTRTSRSARAGGESIELESVRMPRDVELISIPKHGAAARRSRSA